MFLVVRVILKAVLYYKGKVLQFKRRVWVLRIEVFKKHTAVVVKKEFWLRKALTF